MNDRAKLVEFYITPSTFFVEGHQVRGYVAKENLASGEYLVRLLTNCSIGSRVYKNGQLVVLQTKHVQNLQMSE